jgi:hypothetical protein
VALLLFFGVAAASTVMGPPTPRAAVPATHTAEVAR